MYWNKLQVLAASIHLHPNLIFVGKANNLLLDRSYIRSYILVGSNLAHKY